MIFIHSVFLFNELSIIISWIWIKGLLYNFSLNRCLHDNDNEGKRRTMFEDWRLIFLFNLSHLSSDLFMKFDYFLWPSRNNWWVAPAQKQICLVDTDVRLEYKYCWRLMVDSLTYEWYAVKHCDMSDSTARAPLRWPRQLQIEDHDLECSALGYQDYKRKQ